MRSLTIAAGIAALASLGAIASPTVDGAERSRPAPRESFARPGTARRSNLVFEENRGQTAHDVAFLARARGFTAFLSPGGVTLALPRPAGIGRDIVGFAFRGTGRPGPTLGREPTGGISTYVRGTRTVSGARHYAEAVTTDLHPGVDLRWRGDERGRLTYDLLLAPGADPSRIEFDVSGGTSVRIAADGTLRIATSGGEITHTRPVVFQETTVGRVAVRGAFAMRGERRVGFDLGPHDPALPLVIDPSVEFADTFGGSGRDHPRAIAVDADGSAYVTGQTLSADFPVDAGSGGTLGGDADAFVTKLTADGSAVAWSMYLGGSGSDGGDGIAVNAAGEAVVCGSAVSSDFPLVAAPGAPTGARPGFPGVFVSKIAADGRSLVWSCSLGAATGDSSIAIDSLGDAYVLGSTILDAPLATAGAFQVARGGYSDAFVVKLDGGTSAVRFATFVGGAGAEYANRIAVDAAGSAYICGTTRASASFPATKRFAPPQPDDAQDAFVAKLAPDGSSLAYAVTFGAETAQGIDVDAAGAAYVTGFKSRVEFPITHFPAGVKDRLWGAYVLKIAPSGEAPEYSTILVARDPPSPGSEAWADGNRGLDIRVAADGSACVLGYTYDGFGPPYALDEHIVRGPFVARLTPNARRMTYGAQVGTSDSESGAMAMGGDGSLFVLGDHFNSNAPINAAPVRVAGPPPGQTEVCVVKLAPQNSRLSVVVGDVWDGPDLRDRFQCVARHPFASPAGAFDPHAKDVSVAVGAGGNVRTLEIPAGDRGWRRSSGGWSWQSPLGAKPRWRVAFVGTQTVQVLLRFAGFTVPVDNPFSVGVSVGTEHAFDLDHWPIVRGPGPTHHRLR